MAKPNLTQLKVDRLRPDPTKRIEISDHLLPQLRLVVQPSGAKSWAVRTRIHGKAAKLTIGNARVIDLAEARDKAREELRKVEKGEDPRATKREAAANTLGTVADQYLRHVVAERRKRTQIECRRHLSQHWLPLHARPLAELTRRKIAAHLLELKDRRGAVAANRSRSTISAMFTWAVRQGLIDVNPVTGTAKLGDERPRERVLSIEELRAIWQATDGGGAHDAIIRLAMLLGQRKGEIGAMMWSEVDLERALWSIPGSKTKNGRGNVVPLSSQAVEIIKARLAVLEKERQERTGGKVAQLGEYVFGERGTAPFSGWSRCKRRSDGRIARQRAEQRLGRKLAEGEEPEPGDHLPNWVVHDLRRSYVTHLCEIGVPPHVVEACVNHISGHKGGVAGVYNRSTYAAEKAKAMQKWADTLLAHPAPNVVQFPPARSA